MQKLCNDVGVPWILMPCLSKCLSLLSEVKGVKTLICGLWQFKLQWVICEEIDCAKNFPAKSYSRRKNCGKKLFWNGKRKQLSCTCILSRLQDLLVLHSPHPPPKNTMFPHFSPHFYILYLISVVCTSFLRQP